MARSAPVYIPEVEVEVDDDLGDDLGDLSIDWNAPDDYVFMQSAPRLTPEEHEAWLAEQDACIAQAKKDAKGHVKHIDMPDADDWTNNPFEPVQWPFGVFLEPEGYQAIRRMTRPNTASYRHHMPRTVALARTIHQALPVTDVWGKQTAGHKAAWETITAGEWVQGVSKGRPYRFLQKPMSEWDILKMLASPDARSLANTDATEEIYTRVAHIRIDIDMDDTFDCFQPDDEAMADLQGEIGLVHDVFEAFGLHAYVFRTGNRGIQAVAPLPWMDRSVAWVLTETIRTVLQGTRRRTWCATDYMSSLDGLMRLPLGLHWGSSSLALFLATDGRVLPPEEQITTFMDAFVVRPEDYSLAWADEMRPSLGTAHELPGVTLAEIVAEFPRNPLVRTFLAACDQFDVEGWEKRCVTHAKGENHESVSVQHEASLAEPESGVNPKSVTHAKGKNSKKVFSGIKGTTLGASPAKLKKIGWDILNEGFKPGASFEYYVNVMHEVTGRNAIGWALVVHDGDVDEAKGWLDNQADSVAGSLEDKAQRKALIAWGLAMDDDGNTRNNTYRRFQERKSAASHRGISGEVAESDTLAAQRIVSALPALRLGSEAKRKTFRQESLVVIAHILELTMAVARESADGLVRVSDRTRAAEISLRWPKDATNAMTVSRQMNWITKGRPDCLLEALEIVEKPAKITEPTVYRLGPGM